jgi:hypothetical protein
MGLRRMLRHDNATWWQGNREIFPKDVAYIRTLTKRFPSLSRKELTYTLCEHLRLGHLTGRPGFPGPPCLAREGVRSETVR